MADENPFDGEFLKREVTITGANGDTEFTISKLPATKGWDTLERIREQIGRDFQFPRGEELGVIIMKTIGGLPRSFVADIRTTMFEHVTFRNRMAVSPMTLAGNEEMAFDAVEIEPADIYDLFLRTLCVNFTASFRDLFDKMSRSQSQSSPSPDTGTSPPSSPQA